MSPDIGLSESAYAIDPSRAVKTGGIGWDCAMAEVLILIALQHKASRLEFRTIEGAFRIAEIIDEKAFEFPSPPECLREPILRHLCTIFAIGPNTEGEREFRGGASQAKFRCAIRTNAENALISVLQPIAPSTDVVQLIDRFWRTRASEKGVLSLLKFYFEKLACHWKPRQSCSGGMWITIVF